MHDRSHRHRHPGSKHDDAPTRGPGKHTLTEHLIGRQRPPIFAHGGVWEDVGAEDPERHLGDPERPHGGDARWNTDGRKDHGAPERHRGEHDHSDEYGRSEHDTDPAEALAHFDVMDHGEERHFEIIEVGDDEHDEDDEHGAEHSAAQADHDEVEHAEHEGDARRGHGRDGHDGHGHERHDDEHDVAGHGGHEGPAGDAHEEHHGHDGHEDDDHDEHHAHGGDRHHDRDHRRRHSRKEERANRVNAAEAFDLLGTYDAWSDRAIDGKLELDHHDHDDNHDHDDKHDRDDKHEDEHEHAHAAHLADARHHEHDHAAHVARAEHREHAELELVLRPRGEGRQLEEHLLHELEQLTGFRLDHVRIHIGGEPGSALARHGKRGATRGRHIWFPDGAYRPDDAWGKDLIRHEVNHVVQQGSGHVPSKLDDGARASYEADADRRLSHHGKPRKRSELRQLFVQETGPAQFMLIDGPVRRPAPRRPTPKPRPAPKPVYHPVVGDDHWNDNRRAAPRPAPTPRPRPKPVYHPVVGDDHWNDSRRAAPRRPKPVYHPVVGDDHWNDANLRGAGVAEKVRRDALMRQNLTRLAHMDRRKPKLPPPLKLTRRERHDLRAFERSEELVRQGVAVAHAARLRREAEERRRRAAAAAAKKKKGGGILGFAHKALDLAGNAPIVGGAAGALDAGIYVAEGKYAEAAVAAAGAVGGAVPLPPGVGHALGKAVAKKVAKKVIKHGVDKAAKKGVNTAVKASQLPKTITKQERKALAKRLNNTGRQLRKQARDRRVRKWEKRGGKIHDDIVANQTFGNAAKILASDAVGLDDDKDK